MSSSENRSLQEIHRVIGAMPEWRISWYITSNSLALCSSVSPNAPITKRPVKLQEIKSIPPQRKPNNKTEKDLKIKITRILKKKELPRIMWRLQQCWVWFLWVFSCLIKIWLFKLCSTSIIWNYMLYSCYVNLMVHWFYMYIIFNTRSSF